MSNIKVILIAIVVTLGLMVQEQITYIFNSNKNNKIADWYIVNDGVMGGLSEGKLAFNKSGNAIFKGYVTTENNGGFSSVRMLIDKKDVSNFNYIVLRLKGDKKDYQFRIKETSSDRYSYVSDFKTSGSWETIKIPFATFTPRFRGNNLNMPNYSGKMIQEISILIGNKKEESFSLEIESIGLK